MTVSTSQAISRKAFVATALAAMGAAAGSPLKLIAQETTADVLDRFLINVDGNTITVVDSETGDYGIITLDQMTKSASVVYSDGSSSAAYADEAGNVYINGILSVAATTIEMPATRAVPSGFIPLVTQRYVINLDPTVIANVKDLSSFIATVAPIVLSLGSGPAIALAIANLLFNQMLNGLRSGYLEVRQYYHPQTYYVYTVVTLYRNSNYTGVIQTWEDGPIPPV